MARTEVTIRSYLLLDPFFERMEDSRGEKTPVIGVTVEQARRFCERLTTRSGLHIRLPSEAEWEFACKAGTGTRYSSWDDDAELMEYAWVESNSEGRPHPVATGAANDWGLFDMHGNAREWCEDGWHCAYDGAPTDGSAGNGEAEPGNDCRGGDWLWPAVLCLSSLRRHKPPGYASNYIGFRPVFTLPDDD